MKGSSNHSASRSLAHGVRTNGSGPLTVLRLTYTLCGLNSEVSHEQPVLTTLPPSSEVLRALSAASSSPPAVGAFATPVPSQAAQPGVFQRAQGCPQADVEQTAPQNALCSLLPALGSLSRSLICLSALGVSLVNTLYAGTP